MLSDDYSHEAAHQSFRPVSAFARSLIALAYPLLRSPAFFIVFTFEYIIAAGHGRAATLISVIGGALGGGKDVFVKTLSDEVDCREAFGRNALGDLDTAAREPARTGIAVGGDIPISASGDCGETPLLKSDLFLRVAISTGGGVSRESTSPIASIAPPSISVRSLSVAECDILMEGSGE